MDDTFRTDLTDWATLLEALDGTRAPFAALSTVAAAWARRQPSRRPAESRPPPTAPAGVNWCLVP